MIRDMMKDGTSSHKKQSPPRLTICLLPKTCWTAQIIQHEIDRCEGVLI